MKYIISIISILLISGCNTHDVLRYDLKNFLTNETINREPQNLSDSVVLYIESILTANSQSKSYNYFPEINSLDVSFYMSTIGDDTYLGGVGDFVGPFMNSSQKLMAMGVFLRNQYNLRKNSFDQILRECIRLDSNNFLAFYLLSELRYKEGYIMEAKYLVEILYKKIPHNKEVKRLYEGMEKTQAADYKTLDEFLKEEAYYQE